MSTRGVWSPALWPGRWYARGLLDVAIGPISPSAALSSTIAVVGLLATSGCLWLPLPGFPVDRETPTPEDEADTRTLTHCRPQHSNQKPVLLGVQTGEREFGCRARTPETITWTVELDDTAIGTYQLAGGVPSLRLSRDDLPWHAIPYEAVVRVEARGEGESTSREWTVLVLPDPNALRLKGPEE